MIFSGALQKNPKGPHNLTRQHIQRAVWRSWVNLGSGCLTALFCILALSSPTTADSATPIAVSTCDPCTSLSDLQSATQQTALKQQWANYNNAIVLMTSLNAPISAFFRLTVSYTTAWGTRIATYTATPITTDNMAAGALDNQIFARALKFAPLISPPNIAYNSSGINITDWIQTQLLYNFDTGIDPWHMLPGFASSVYFQLRDVQTGQVEDVFFGDTITINFPNGYSEKFKFLGIGPSIEWQAVPGTLMHNGQPVNPPTTQSGVSIPGASDLGNTNVYNPGTIQMINSNVFCTGNDNVSVTLPDGTAVTGTGFYTFPC